MVGRQMISR